MVGVAPAATDAGIVSRIRHDESGGLCRAVAQGRKAGKGPIPGPKLGKPLLQVDPRSGGFRRSCTAILDEHFLPRFLLLVVPVQRLHAYAFGVLAVGRGDVPDVQPAADTAAGADLSDDEPGQGRRIGQIGLFRFDQSDKGAEGTGYGFLDRLVPGLGIEAAKGIRARRRMAGSILRKGSWQAGAD